ncbi:MAG: hypothetical protein H6737_23210 [Alphaproteobacteria bacterium]|nr:hypothetical protein [Alphaproteobacteria bacterium]
MSDVAALLDALAAIDPRAATWCAAQCARTVLDRVAPGESRPLAAVEAAEAWALRPDAATRRACEHAAREASAAVYAPHPSSDDVVADAAYYATHSAADAAWSASQGTAAAGAAREAAWAAGASAESTRAALARADAADEAGSEAAEAALIEARRRAVAAHLDALGGLVRGLRWPLTTPTAAELAAAPPVLRVAWDRVTEQAVPAADLAIDALIDAARRAERLGLAWDDRVARSIAERADEASVAVLLGRAGLAPDRSEM